MPLPISLALLRIMTHLASLALNEESGYVPFFSGPGYTTVYHYHGHFCLMLPKTNRMYLIQDFWSTAN